MTEQQRSRDRFGPLPDKNDPRPFPKRGQRSIVKQSRVHRRAQAAHVCCNYVIELTQAAVSLVHGESEPFCLPDGSARVFVET